MRANVASLLCGQMLWLLLTAAACNRSIYVGRDDNSELGVLFKN